MCCIHHQSETSAVHWSQRILELRALRKHLNNKQKIKLMTTDHRILTVNGGFHIFISLPSSQSPPIGQVSSIDRNSQTGKWQEKWSPSSGTSNELTRLDTSEFAWGSLSLGELIIQCSFSTCLTEALGSEEYSKTLLVDGCYHVTV